MFKYLPCSFFASVYVLWIGHIVCAIVEKHPKRHDRKDDTQSIHSQFSLTLKLAKQQTHRTIIYTYKLLCVFRALLFGVHSLHWVFTLLLLFQIDIVDTQVNLTELLYHSYTNIPPILYENCHSHTAYLRSVCLFTFSLSLVHTFSTFSPCTCRTNFSIKTLSRVRGNIINRRRFKQK